MLILILKIAGVWFGLSILFAVAWARFMGRINPR